MCACVPGSSVSVKSVCPLQYKTSEVRSKCASLMRVNLYKDQIAPSGSMPPLPNDKALYASLRPAYNVLKAAGQQRASGRPMYAITDDQKKAADTFLKVPTTITSCCCCFGCSGDISPGRCCTCSCAFACLSSCAETACHSLCSPGHSVWRGLLWGLDLNPQGVTVHAGSTAVSCLAAQSQTTDVLLVAI